ncbi:MAG: sigma-70 family RNA polymerase sigma factor [Magnetococcales bacterium]|nr:sigma-70 family RNA polymerase sigma factor [Magnetococcales bacterium]
MESRNHYHGIHPYAVSTVRHHARRLVRSPGFLPADVEDIEQELMLDMHRRLARFDDSKAGVRTFIARVVVNHVATMLEGLRQVRNGDIEMISLHETVHDGDGMVSELIDTISSSQSPWFTHGLPWHESIDLQTDVSRLLARLPPSLRWLAERLMEETISELSTATGTPRHMLYVAVEKIRNKFNQIKIAKIKSDRFRIPPVCKG